MRESSQSDEVFEDDDYNGVPDVVSHHARQLDLFELDDIARPDYNIGKSAGY